MSRLLFSTLNHFSHWFSGIKIRNKLFLSNFILISVMIIAIACFSFTRINAVLYEQARKEMDSSMLQLKENIENRLTLYQEVSKSIFYNQDLLELLTNKYKDNLDAYDAFKKSKAILRTLEISDPTLAGISIYVFNPSFLADGSYFLRIKESVKQNPWFQELLHTEVGGVWLKTYENYQGEKIVAYQRLLYEYKKSFQLVGILRMEIPESIIHDYITAEANNKEIYILDPNGDVITASNKSVLGQNIKNNTYVERAFEKDHGQFVTQVNGHERLIVYYTTYNSWKLIGVVPLDLLKENTGKINSFIIGVYFAAIISLLIITYFIAEVLTRKLNVLYEGVKKVQKGEYTHKVDMAGEDEIGQLAIAYNQMTDQLQYMFHEAYEAKIKMKELEFKALQSQINPHFLNNVLSSIGWLAMKKGAPEVRQMAMETAKFYRFSLSVGNDMVTLAEELEQVRAYVEIQKVRFSNCIDISFQIQESLYQFKIMKLTLQPLVENCINHGMREDHVLLHICLRGYRGDLYNVLEIEDDGVGIPADRMSSLLIGDADDGDSKVGYGIKNVNERIKLHFGQDYGIQMFSKVDKGTTARIKLPLL
ncbi:MAG TPA: histidine kinase [Ruminiclostridium sp.]